MHYFKDKKGELTNVEDKYWESVKKLEPWLKETDARGNELGKQLTSIKSNVKSTGTKRKRTAEGVNRLEKLKEEKLNVEKIQPDDLATIKQKQNVKSTGTKRKRTAKKA